LVAWLAASAGGAESRQQLRWKLAAGDKLQLQLTQTNRFETVVKDKPLVLTVQMAMELAWTVERADVDGTLRISQSFVRFVVKTSTPDGKTVLYDSSARGEPPIEMQELAEAVPRLLGTECTLRLTARGEIADVQAAPETESRLRSLPGAARLQQLLTREGIQQTLRQSLGVLPKPAVAAGDTWEDAWELDSPAGRVRVASTYTDRGSATVDERLLERIDVATAVSPQGDAPRVARPAAPLRQEYRGTLYFDAAAGRLVRSELQQVRESPAKEGGPPVSWKAANTVLLRVR
jgi:hypothetical protein